jgi:hypothetical protein
MPVVSSDPVLPPPRKSIIDQYRYAHPQSLNSDLGCSLNPSSESSDKNSDHDATANVLQHPEVEGGGEAAVDHGLTKQRRQQKRLEVIAGAAAAATLSRVPFLFILTPSSLPPPQADKVAKKPKPAIPTPSPPRVRDEDVGGGAAQSVKKAAGGEEKMFEFVGDVLYNVRASACCRRCTVMLPLRAHHHGDFAIHSPVEGGRAALLWTRRDRWIFGDNRHW